MNFGQWMQMHRRSLLFVIALLAIAGALSAFRLPISLFPNVAFPRAVVSLDAGDRPAEQMATLVTMPVEEALRRVPNVLDVESKTSRGLGGNFAQLQLGHRHGASDVASAIGHQRDSRHAAAGHLDAGAPHGPDGVSGARLQPDVESSSRSRRCAISRSSRCGRCCRRSKAWRAWT